MNFSSLCVVGNINRDLRIAPIRPGPHLFTDGETSVAWIRETVGGGGANTACAAASLGARVAFLGKVGDDWLGHRLDQTLARHGVSPHLKKDPARPTGTSINLVYETGHRHFVSWLPNNRGLGFEDLDLSVLPQYDHLLRADIWFSDSMLYGGNERLLEEARRAGVAASIDLNWDPRWGVSPPDEIRQRKDAIRKILPLVDLAHGNIAELNAFADSPDLGTTLGRLEQWGVKGVVVHMGADGAGYYQQGTLVVEQPAPAQRQVNTTGTGDVLSACMMLLHSDPDMSIQVKLRFANAIVAEFMEGRREVFPVL